MPLYSTHHILNVHMQEKHRLEIIIPVIISMIRLALHDNPAVTDTFKSNESPTAYIYTLYPFIFMNFMSTEYSH